MEAIKKIVERNGNSLTIDIPSSITSTKFEVIVLPIEEYNAMEEWKNSIYKNQVFNFLNDPEEDIYTINDGKPYVRKP